MRERLRDGERLLELEVDRRQRVACRRAERRTAGAVPSGQRSGRTGDALGGAPVAPALVVDGAAVVPAEVLVDLLLQVHAAEVLRLVELPVQLRLRDAPRTAPALQRLEDVARHPQGEQLLLAEVVLEARHPRLLLDDDAADVLLRVRLALVQPLLQQLAVGAAAALAVRLEPLRLARALLDERPVEPLARARLGDLEDDRVEVRRAALELEDVLLPDLDPRELCVVGRRDGGKGGREPILQHCGERAVAGGGGDAVDDEQQRLLAERVGVRGCRRAELGQEGALALLRRDGGGRGAGGGRSVRGCWRPGQRGRRLRRRLRERRQAPDKRRIGQALLQGVEDTRDDGVERHARRYAVVVGSGEHLRGGLLLRRP